MSKIMHCLQLIVLTTFFNYFQHCNSQCGGSYTDETADLLNIFSSVDGLSALGDWDSTCDACDWSGIGCDGSGYITSIILNNANLTGELDTSIYWPSYLQYLWLDRNQFSGLFDLTKLPNATLYDLRIDYNNFTGEFNWAGKTALSVMEIYHNNFNQPLNWNDVPSSLYNVYMSDNHFSGTIDFSALPNGFTVLDLSNNDFTGSVDLTRSWLISDSTWVWLNLRNNRGLYGPLDYRSIPAKVQILFDLDVVCNATIYCPNDGIGYKSINRTVWYCRGPTECESTCQCEPTGNYTNLTSTKTVTTSATSTTAQQTTLSPTLEPTLEPTVTNYTYPPTGDTNSPTISPTETPTEIETDETTSFEQLSTTNSKIEDKGNGNQSVLNIAINLNLTQLIVIVAVGGFLLCLCLTTCCWYVCCWKGRSYHDERVHRKASDLKRKHDRLRIVSAGNVSEGNLSSLQITSVSPSMSDQHLQHIVSQSGAHGQANLVKMQSVHENDGDLVPDVATGANTTTHGHGWSTQ